MTPRDEMFTTHIRPPGEPGTDTRIRNSTEPRTAEVKNVPKVVDHEQRRRQIIEVVWRLLAARGMAALSMRAIAEEAGYANGILAYYFADKDAVLRAAHEHVLAATNDRIARSVGDARGLAALRAACSEIMPLTDESLLEARIASALWQWAVYDEEIRAIGTEAWDGWRRLFVRHIGEAVDGGEIDEVDVHAMADNVLTLVLGFQVTATLSPESTSPEHQWGVLELTLSSRLTGRGGVPVGPGLGRPPMPAGTGRAGPGQAARDSAGDHP